MSDPTPIPRLRVLDADADARPNASSGSAVGISGWGIWKALLWSEWFSHSRLMLVAILAWLLAVWFLPMVVHPLWILGLGVTFALISGPAFGGADVIHGCEEYSFSLPCTRAQRYASRLLMGGGSVLVFSVMDLLALRGNLSDVVLRLFVTGGYPAVQLNQPLLLYGLVLAVPFAVFALGFSLAALASSRTVAFSSWVWGALGSLVVLRGGIQLEELRFDRPNGWFAVPLLSAVAIGSLWIGGRRYRLKEAVTGGGPLRMAPGWWLALGALIAAGIGVALLLAWFASNFPRLL